MYPSKEEAIEILSTKTKLRDTGAKNKNLTIKNLLLIFSYDELNMDAFKKRLSRKYKKQEDLFDKINELETYLKKKKINVDEIVQTNQKTKSKTTIEDSIEIVEATAKKYDALLSMFNNSTTEVDKLIKKFRDGKGDKKLTDEIFRDDLLEIYMATVGKAKGTIPTRKVNTQHKIIEKEDGSIDYQLINAKGQNFPVAYIETQTHLPDSSAIGAIPFLIEALERLSGGNTPHATAEEKNKMMLEHMKATQAEREKYQGKEYSDAELVDEVEESEE